MAMPKEFLVMRFLTLLGCVVAALAGCAPSITPLIAGRATVRDYTLGVERKASIGDPLFVIRNGIVRPGYEARRDYIPPQYDIWNGGLNYPMIAKGMLFGAVGSGPDSTILISNPDFTASNPLFSMLRDTSSIRVDILIDRIGGVVNQFQHVNSTSFAKLFGSQWATEPLFAPSASKFIERGGFRAEMIFTGLTGNTLKAVYREYIGDYIRPAFTTELQYNLSDSKVIAYKSVKIEILWIDNQAAEYRVLSDDDLPWVQ
jgi:hypothetical protein